ncbi:MAG: glycoside hydrolase family 16 protein [Flavobacteriaceae bacterium]|nr:glycoside hydrolase family 16 protein [Flavobacteriaceae bacterium]
MRTILLFKIFPLLIIFLVITCSSNEEELSNQMEITTETYYLIGEDLTLIWSDEFDYEGSPDIDKWHHQTIAPNNGSWWNGELQHYTNRLENSSVNNGTLKIKAKKEQYEFDDSSKSYTSARLNSKFSFRYGRIDVRAKLPKGSGTWPAIWTLGANINEIGNYFGDHFGNVGWPACGEIDIMEQNGWNKNNVIGHLHWEDNSGQYKNQGGTKSIENSYDEFHTYSLVWDSSKISILLDDNTFFSMANTSNNPYDNDHYLLINIAVGGNLGGDVPSNFSEEIMEIDYVRIYQ